MRHRLASCLWPVQLLGDTPFVLTVGNWTLRRKLAFMGNPHTTCPSWFRVYNAKPNSSMMLSPGDQEPKPTPRDQLQDLSEWLEESTGNLVDVISTSSESGTADPSEPFRPSPLHTSGSSSRKHNVLTHFGLRDLQADKQYESFVQSPS